MTEDAAHDLEDDEPMAAGAFYGRISREDLKEVEKAADKNRAVNDAIARQRRSVALAMLARGSTIAEDYTDRSISAFKTGVKRQDWDRLIADIRAGRWTGKMVGILKLDRACRRIKDSLMLAEALEESGTHLLSVLDGFDTSTPTGRAFYFFTAVFAQLESETISLRVRERQRELREQGWWRGGGRRPFGYSEDWREVVPIEADLIVDAASRVVSGDGVRGISMDWNRRGITTVSGQTWTPPKVSRLLREPRLSGRMYRDPRPGRAEDRQKVQWTPAMQPSTGKLPAILDTMTHDLVIARLSDPARQPTGIRSEYLLTGGLLVCGVCKHRLYPIPQRRQGPRYACRKDHGGCGQVSSKGAPVDALVAEMTIQRVSDPAVAAHIRATLDSELPHVDLVELHSVEQELKEVSIDYYNEHRIPREAFELVTDRLNVRIREMRELLARPVASVSLDALANPAVAFASGGPVETRRALVRLAFDRVELHPTTKRGRGFDPDRVRPVLRDYGTTEGDDETGGVA